MDLVLTDFIGHGIIFGICCFVLVFAFMSKNENKDIVKGLPFFIIVMAVILYDAYSGGEFFSHIMDAFA